MKAALAAKREPSASAPAIDANGAAEEMDTNGILSNGTAPPPPTEGMEIDTTSDTITDSKVRGDGLFCSPAGTYAVSTEPLVA